MKRQRTEAQEARIPSGATFAATIVSCALAVVLLAPAAALGQAEGPPCNACGDRRREFGQCFYD